MLLIVAAVLGFVIGVVARGDVRRLGDLRLRWPVVVLVALAIKELGVWGPLAGSRVWAPVLYSVSLAVLIAWAVWHVRRLPGVWLAALGMAMNLAVVLANGGHMPVAPDLAHRGPSQLVEQGYLGQYVLEGPGTRLAYLDDRIQLPGVLGTLLPQAYSLGDLVMSAGLFVVTLLATHVKTGTPREGR
jgi:hypothetical protein